VTEAARFLQSESGLGRADTGSDSSQASSWQRYGWMVSRAASSASRESLLAGSKKEGEATTRKAEWKKAGLRESREVQAAGSRGSRQEELWSSMYLTGREARQWEPRWEAGRCSSPREEEATNWIQMEEPARYLVRE
jgi:hypothetical protein